MDEISVIKCWCETQIELMQESIEKSRFMTRRKKRWVMAEICGIQKVINRLNRMEVQHEQRQ